MSGRWRTATLTVALVIAFVQLSHTAYAAFVHRVESSSTSVSTATLAPPKGLTAASGCVLLVPRVNLSWTRSASGFVAGYRVYRRPASGGTWTLLTTLTGSTYTDATVAGGSSYTYVVHAFRSGWSAPSNEVSASVPLVCL